MQQRDSFPYNVDLRVAANLRKPVVYVENAGVAFGPILVSYDYPFANALQGGGYQSDLGLFGFRLTLIANEQQSA